MRVHLAVSVAVVAAVGSFASGCAPEVPPQTTTTTSTSTTTTSTTTTTTTTTPGTEGLDQSLTGDPEWSLGGFAAAQTFTAGRSGVLDKISLHSLQSVVPVEISIQNLTGSGAPDGTPIASATVLDAPISMTGLADIPLSTPVPVMAGVKYALVIDWLDGSGALAGRLGDEYSGGEVWFFQGGIQWARLGLVTGQEPDLIFQTWVT